MAINQHIYALIERIMLENTGFAIRFSWLEKSTKSGENSLFWCRFGDFSKMSFLALIMVDIGKTIEIYAILVIFLNFKAPWLAGSKK